MPTRLQDASREISIHALREEGDVHLLFASQSFLDISIHALREEGDARTSGNKCMVHYFYPRPPRGGRHQHRQSAGHHWISIHALREEGDPDTRKWRGSQSKYFYPRPPRGGRLHGRSVVQRGQSISIHALREEGDSLGWGDSYYYTKFLSTPSARRATLAGCRTPAP